MRFFQLEILETTLFLKISLRLIISVYTLFAWWQLYVAIASIIIGYINISSCVKYNY